jgi:uncharacterized protein (TIGR03435 family)
MATIVLATDLRSAAQSAPSPETEPRFEVASVRPTSMTPFELGRQAGAAGGRVSIPPMGVRPLPNGLNASMSTLRMLIVFAYQIRDYQLSGGPSWLDSDRFDITARAAGEVTPDVARRMLQSLLRDRFMLRTHTETREADVHALVLARSDGRLGPGLKRTSPECEATLEERKKGAAAAAPPPPPNFEQIRKQTTCGLMMMGSSASGAANYSMGGMALERLVSQISGEIRGPVVDRTGLTGLFDILLEFASERRPLQAAAPNAPNPTADIPPPTLRAALQEQLGLKLETEKGPLDVLVIDSAERPIEN